MQTTQELKLALELRKSIPVPLTLELPQGGREIVYRYPLPENGEASYVALGVSRREFSSQLMRAANDPLIRKLLAPEIEEMLMEEKVEPDLFTNCEDDLEELLKTYFAAKRDYEYIQYRLLFSNKQAKNADTFFEEERKATKEGSQTSREAIKPESSKKNPDRTTTHSKANSKSVKLNTREAAALKEAQEKFTSVKVYTQKKLKGFCLSEDVFKSYVIGYISKPGKPLICSVSQHEKVSQAGELQSTSLDLLARLNHLNVRVWKCAKGGSKRDVKGGVQRGGRRAEASGVLNVYKECQNNSSFNIIEVLMKDNKDNHVDILSPRLDLSLENNSFSRLESHVDLLQARRAGFRVRVEDLETMDEWETGRELTERGLTGKEFTEAGMTKAGLTELGAIGKEWTRLNKAAKDPKKTEDIKTAQDIKATQDIVPQHQILIKTTAITAGKLQLLIKIIDTKCKRILILEQEYEKGFERGDGSSADPLVCLQLPGLKKACVRLNNDFGIVAQHFEVDGEVIFLTDENLELANINIQGNLRVEKCRVLKISEEVNVIGEAYFSVQDIKLSNGVYAKRIDVLVGGKIHIRDAGFLFLPEYADQYLNIVLEAYKNGFEISLEDLSKDEIKKITDRGLREKVTMSTEAVSDKIVNLVVSSWDIGCQRKIRFTKDIHVEKLGPAERLQLPGHAGSELILNAAGRLSVKNVDVFGDIVLSVHEGSVLMDVKIHGDLIAGRNQVLMLNSDTYVGGLAQLSVKNLNFNKNLWASSIELILQDNLLFPPAFPFFANNVVIHVNNGAEITSPLKFSGSLRLIVNPLSKKSVNILSDITLGNTEGNSDDAEVSKEVDSHSDKGVLNPLQEIKKFSEYEHTRTGKEIKELSEQTCTRSPKELRECSVKRRGRVAHLDIEHRGSMVRIGAEHLPFVNIIVTGKASINASKFDLVKGRIVGYQGIAVSATGLGVSATGLGVSAIGSGSGASDLGVLATGADVSAGGPNIRIGRINSTLPCGLITNGQLSLKTTNTIIFESSEAYARGGFHFIAPLKVEVIASKINAANDAIVDSPCFKIRLLTEYSTGGQSFNIPKGNAHEASRTLGTSEKAVTGPSSVRVEKILTTTGTTELFASLLHFKNFVGLAPKLSNFIPYQNYTNNFFCGHKDPGRSRWFNNAHCDYGTPIMAVCSASTDLVLRNSELDLMGIVFAPNVKLTMFMKGTIGKVSLHIALPAPKAFKQMFNLAEEMRRSPRFDYVGPHYNTLFRSVIPRGFKLKKSYPAPVILDSDGTLRSTTKAVKNLMPYEMKAEILVEILMREFGRGILDENITCPELMLHDLLANASGFFKEHFLEKGLEGSDKSVDALVHKNANIPAAQENPIWFETLPFPIMVYKEVMIEERMTLTPLVIFPKRWNNIRLRDWVGGLFALSDIKIEGFSRDVSSLIITAHLEAGDKIKFSHLAGVIHHKNTYEEVREEEDIVKESSLFGVLSSTTVTRKKIKSVILQPGNTMTAEKVEYEDVGAIDWHGPEIVAGRGGVQAVVNVGKISEHGVLTAGVKHHAQSAGNDFCDISVVQNIQTYDIHRTEISSLGPVHLHTDQQHYRSMAMAAESDVKMSAEKLLKFDCTRVEEHSPMEVAVSKMCRSLTTGSAERGVGVILSSSKKVECESRGTLHGIGTTVVAESAKMHSVKGSVLEPMVLRQSSSTETLGIDGFSFIDRMRTEHYEQGSPPTLMAEKEIEISVEKGDAVLIAPVFCAGEKVEVKTPKGTIYIKPASYQQDITEDEFSVGLTFLGSKVIEASMRRDFKDAANHLLREFPWLASMEEVINPNGRERDKDKKETADKISSGMRILYSAYRTYLNFWKSSSWMEFAKTQIQPNPKLRFGARSSEQRWTEVALPWLQAKKIIMTGQNVKSSGTQGKCEELKITADRVAELHAGSRTLSQRMAEVGLSLGFYPVSASVDLSAAEKEAQEYLVSHFNVSGVTSICAGDKISLRGVWIETLKAVLAAEQLELETLQNKNSATHFSATVSTDKAVGMSAGYEDKIWGETQTGIHAKDTLLANIRKQIYLVGAKLSVGNEAKPRLASLPEGQSFSFYEYSLGGNDLALIFNITRETLFKKPLRVTHLNSTHLSTKPLSTLNKAIIQTLEMWFKAAVIKGVLPAEMQNEYTEGLRQNINAMGPELFSEKVKATMTEERMTEFLRHLITTLTLDPLDAGNLQIYNYEARLNVLASLMETRIRVWDLYKGNLRFLFTAVPAANTLSVPVPAPTPTPTPALASKTEKFEVIELCYSTGQKTPWSLLHTKPGLVCAQEIIGKTLANRHESQSVGLSVSASPLGADSSCKAVGDFDYQNKERQENLKAVVAAPIDIKASTVTNVERHENDAREKVREESTHVASLVPIGSPVAMMEETRHVLTTKPAMLNDRKPVMLSGKMAMTPQPAGADLSGHFAAPSGSRVGR